MSFCNWFRCANSCVFVSPLLSWLTELDLCFCVFGWYSWLARWLALTARRTELICNLKQSWWFPSPNPAQNFNKTHFCPCSSSREQEQHYCETFCCILKRKVCMYSLWLRGLLLKRVHHLPLILIPVSDHRRWVAFCDEPGCLWTPEWRLTRCQIAEVTGDGCVFGLEGRQAWRLSCSPSELSAACPQTHT